MSCGEVRTTNLKLANRSKEGISAMASLYSTKVTASGGRHGSIRSEDGLLDLKLALPRALGGRGDATNPEQLFAGGYAACFENALLHVSRDAGHRFADDDIDVVARIDLSRNETGGFVLAAALAVTVAGIDQQTAERLVQGAHTICPYSKCDPKQYRCGHLRLGPVSPTDRFHNPTSHGEQTCSCSTAGCSCVPALPPPPLHSPPPPPAWPTRPKRASGRNLASTASSSAPSRSPLSATARSRSRPKRCGAIGRRTQEACLHPRSSH